LDGLRLRQRLRVSGGQDLVMAPYSIYAGLVILAVLNIAVVLFAFWRQP
jgi:hypothetical protein